MVHYLKSGDSAVRAYQQAFSYASTYSSGWLHSLRPESSNNFIATVSRSVRSVEEDRPRSFIETYLPAGSNLQRVGSMTAGASKPTIFDFAPDSHTTFAAYNSLSSKEDSPYIEINLDPAVASAQCSYRVDVSSLHGDFVADSWFGGCTWSSDEKYLAYVAHLKKDKKKTVFSEKKDAAKATAEDEDKVGSSKYNYVDDWGERFTNLEELGLFILDIERQKVIQVPGIDPKQWTVGQPQFLTSGAEDGALGKYALCYTAWNCQPRKLGIVYCYQRPSSLFAADLTQLLSSDNEKGTIYIKHHLLTPAVHSARSPRCSNDGAKLVFLGSKAGFPTHNGCTDIMYIDMHHIESILTSSAESSTDMVKVAVPSVKSCTPTYFDKNGADVTSMKIILDGSFPFPGIYCDQLPRRCFLDDQHTGEHWIALTSMWGSSNILLKVCLETGKVEMIDPFSSNNDEEDVQERGSFNLLDVKRNLLLFSYSTPTSFPILAVKNQSSGSVLRIRSPVRQAVTVKSNAAILKAPTRSAASLDDIRWRIFHHHNDGISFESILLYPEQPVDEVKKLPLVVVPHGGPHSATPTSYIASYSFLCIYLQAAVLHVNYRGSVGFGQEGINSLPGHIGTNDVADMMQAIDHTLSLNDEDLLIDKERIGVVGGSHGGFLTGHLIGQYSDIFKAAAMRNPVTNIPSMVSVSDIPDWCFVEALGNLEAMNSSYDFSTVPCVTEDNLIKMRRCSPIHYLENVKCPTLICLGAKDRRVPPSQGVEYYHLLQARNVKTRLMMFPEDNHAIDKPASEAEHWINIIDWFEEYL